MTDVTKSPTRRLGWLGAWVVAIGLAVGTYGSGVAWADEASGPSGGTDASSSVSDLASRGEDSSSARDDDGPATAPPSVRIATRMASLRLQMAMNRMSQRMTTLTNVLRRASETAQNITGNIK
jgi:hypothetical protein